MVSLRIAVLWLVFAAAPALANDLTGSWELKVGDAAIFRFEISKIPSGKTAAWLRPTRYETDGESFSNVEGPPVRRVAQSVRSIGEDLELSFPDPAPGYAPDVFLLHRVDENHVVATYRGTGFEPFSLVRTAAPPVSLGPWNSGTSYVRVISRSTSAEMTAIFIADQTDRTAPKIDWSKVELSDAKRRIRTQELLTSGALQSGDDYYHAAFVFQHGDTADDYLKAHLLAMIASARGKLDAVWIASATLDRYLQEIGRPQVLGTQFNMEKGKPVSQEPYNRLLVSDAMRRALHVPPLVEQEEQKRQFEQRR